jgi:hypothetical protein
MKNTGEKQKGNAAKDKLDKPVAISAVGFYTRKRDFIEL